MPVGGLRSTIRFACAEICYMFSITVGFILLSVFCLLHIDLFVSFQGLGTSTSKEGREYFANLEKCSKAFIWEDEQDWEAIELAFSKKKIEEEELAQAV